MDLSRAFDTVNHPIIITKLRHYGIRGIALEWFKNYLTNRNQVVKFNNTVSSKEKITCGCNDIVTRITRDTSSLDLRSMLSYTWVPDGRADLVMADLY